MATATQWGWIITEADVDTDITTSLCKIQSIVVYTGDSSVEAWFADTVDNNIIIVPLNSSESNGLLREYQVSFPQGLTLKNGFMFHCGGSDTLTVAVHSASR